MRKVCAWCKRSLTEETAEGPISHGICEACASFVLSDKHSLRDFLDTIDAPLLAVDEEGRALTANGLALQTLGKDGGQVEGKLGGEVMECEYSYLPEGCGKTIHCSGCQVRKSVNHTRKTGQPLIWIQAYMSVLAPNGVKKYDYYVSTERLENGVVLLRIDDARLRETEADRR